MRKIILLFFILTLSIIGITSCRKPEKVYHYLNQTIKDFTVFPANSYWVYIDSITGFKDSISVVSLEQSFFNRAEDVNFLEKYFSVCYSSKFNNTFNRRSFVEGLDSFSMYVENDSTKLISNDQIGLENYGIISNSLFLDSIEVHSNKYFEIIIFNLPDFNNSYFYFAKNIGMIKQKSDTKVIELDHYHINN